MTELVQPVRKIIHVDMDAFYASIEQRDFPDLRGKPVVVGGDSPRSVVAAASYEARKFGIHSAMPMVTAKKKCSQLIIQPLRFQVYRQVSQQIMQIFLSYTDLVEPLALDEAYLDVTDNHLNITYATEIGKLIQKKIFEETNLHASIGISYNKFLAKVASDFQKPRGFFVIRPEQAHGFLEELPIQKFFGVGKVTLQKMHSLGIKNGKDLKEKSLPELIHDFGKLGQFFYNIVRGHDVRQVQPHRQRKSIGCERTLRENLESHEQLKPVLKSLVRRLWQTVEAKKIYGRTVTIKVKFHDFQRITRSKSVDFQIKHIKDFLRVMYFIWVELEFPKPVRLLGLSLTNLKKEDSEYISQQGYLF